LEKEDKLVLADFVDVDPRFERVREETKQFLRELSAKISIPLVLNGELIGLIHLGQKANLKPFRSAEVTFLLELRRSATIALSNSLRLIEMQESLRKWNEELEAKVLERTEQLKEAQKQLIQAEKLATIGVLAGGVAHEINNPLTAVLTNAQILKMNASKDDLESIQLIEAGAKRCQEIIQKIMKYARKPLGPEKTEVVNLNDVVGNVIAFLKYQIEQENIEIVAQKNGDISLIEGNSNELEQVLTNLVLNAKDAVKDVNRPGKIEIKTLTCNGTVGFVVSDNGHGIAPDNLSKIFDPFFTTKDIGKGTGMGLAVTYGIVKKHNGNIDVSSKVGEGTTFMVTFPKMTR
ncbi:MAG TPA: ATP-binding protein, partial [Candidatus Omnitrophota bacterium]|nr:ATP-binding protein [Candidatus Omnitrophota bacterium]